MSGSKLTAGYRVGWDRSHLLDGVEGLVVDVLHPVLLHQGSEHRLDGVHVVWGAAVRAVRARKQSPGLFVI